MRRLWSTFAAALLLVGPASPAIPAQPYTHNWRAIVRVQCTVPDGWIIGTADKISANRYITANHVIAKGQCTVAGEPITITERDQDLDFAQFTGPSTPDFMPISCRGFKATKIYMARGYAGGGFALFELPWLASAVVQGSQQLFLGDAIPGMSGGPVIDKGGQIVGIVNQQLAARSLPLNKTSLCE